MDSGKAMASTPATTQLTPFKYSNRVLLKTILERSDGGLELIGQRVLIGGWVKSSKEVMKQTPPPPHLPAADHETAREPEGKSGVSCVEILQSRIPFLRTIVKVLGGSSSSSNTLRERLDAVFKPAPPSTAFLKVSDGSCPATLQVIVESSIVPPCQLLHTGTCITVEGVLQQSLVQSKHVVELRVEKVLHIGTVDYSKYPLSKKRVPIEKLRECFHIRARTTTVGSVMRIRSALTFGAHTFCHNHGFISVQVPIITTTDCNGFSEKYKVTGLFDKAGQTEEPKAIAEIEGVSLEAIKAAAKEKSSLVEELKRTDSNKEALAAAVQDLRKTNELASQLEAREKSKLKTSQKLDNVKSSEGSSSSSQTFLTVSGRLHLESYACSLGNVYSFGPRFRADKGESPKHVPEMLMFEIEMAFSQLEDVMNCADDFFKFLCKWVLENCPEDMKFVTERIDRNRIDRLQSVISSSFERISYAEALNVLNKVTDKKVETKLQWGAALTEEDLSHLSDEIYKKPVIVYNYPKEAKPFYVRLNDDGKTVAAFDMVVPKIGKLISGSQNEERTRILSTRIEDLGLPREQYEWYLDLRRHGTVKHSGFSLEFDLMVLFATGLTDVRDAIPFPRSYGKANY
ncbi:putative asparagine--tRNA ligase [Rosa chinensis]|uniref:Putative asparagine--tRNA ligase n=1 Tax=Rosa chinensis TaxID=74649 RepID=A0A2P6PTZ2_ROSCH|nr:asparagine--tRNA ligase, cytoplasmic 2 [Rosa chinensis]PRQ25390.1 putative asparagine--tRNA ligase [Rosa chinensis]